MSLGRWRPARGSDLAEGGELRDTAVLELDVAEAVKGLLVGPVEEAERVVEPEGGLCAELALEGRRVTADRAVGAGAKAEATRVARRADFIIVRYARCRLLFKLSY